jgi:hypothetical protein
MYLIVLDRLRRRQSVQDGLGAASLAAIARGSVPAQSSSVTGNFGVSAGHHLHPPIGVIVSEVRVLRLASASW